jgi:N-acetylglutamate synthase-like GNAT family acetyltransferase
MCYTARTMAKKARARTRVEPQAFGEKEFYLEEFRGRSVLIAFAPSAVAARAPLESFRTAVRALVQNDTRVLVWWPAADKNAERRLVAAVVRKPPRTKVRRGKRGRKKKARRATPPPLVRLRAADLARPGGEIALRSALWAQLRRGNLAVVSVAGSPSFPRQPMDLATALRIPKVVLVEPRGGLNADGGRLSFVDENQLETLLAHGEAEWTGLGERRALLVAVREALDLGVEQVNLCAPDGIADELFTYVGSGTLFTEGDYTRVGPLGLDEFGQAERLLERGERAGVLKARNADETAAVLAGGFGVTVCGRHLAGIAGLLTAPYAEERAGEIVGLYTITRFKGEGLGDRLVQRLLAEAELMGLDAVFAVTVDARAELFFTRLGFERVDADELPPAKWRRYDARRKAQLACFVRRLRVPTRSERAS